MKTTYQCLLTMRENALWALEMWSGVSVVEEVRYYKILNRIENAMLNYKGV